MGSNITKVKVTIKGVRPLLLHHFGPDALPLEKREKTGVAGNDPEEWRKTALVNKDGQIYLDPSYAFACIRDGAKYTKKGKGSIQAVVAATLQVLDDSVLINRYLPGFPNGHACDLASAEAPTRDASAPVYLDVRSVKNPSTKGRNVRYRVACSAGWSTSFTILFDKTIVSRAEMEAVLNDAGVLVGIADGRSIGFGRFTVESFEELES
ncbi:MAG TPA: hypothetical protein VF717_09315 [Pyrinomonadaceae bacterium]|jgi:hypothetical protein